MLSSIWKKSFLLSWIPAIFRLCNGVLQQQLLQHHLLRLPHFLQFQYRKPTPRSSSSDGRELNVILFGLPDEGSIVDAKKLWTKCLSFSQGSNFIIIKDMFRLGRLKKSQSYSSPPRPLLIKLCIAWDRKLILLRKIQLEGFSYQAPFSSRECCS